MCDTRFNDQSYSKESINTYLRSCLIPKQETSSPKLTVGTLQRLAGHIDTSWLDGEVAEALDEIQSGEPGNLPIDQLIAPALRTIDDFRNCGIVVVRVAGEGSVLWNQMQNLLLDEESGRVTIVVDDAYTVNIDPRSPTLWTQEDYRLIKERPSKGSGKVDQIARVATASIKLSGFSSHPKIPHRYITGTLRHFTLMGKH